MRAASIRYATELGLQVAGALVKPVGVLALRELLNNPLPKSCMMRSSALRYRLRSNRRSPCPTEGGSAPRRGHAGGIRHAVLSRRMCSFLLPNAAASLYRRLGTILTHALAACQRWRRDHPKLRCCRNPPLVLANAALPEEIEATPATA